MNADFGTNAQAYKPKRVKYEGSSTIRIGMPLCYNWDTTTNILGWDKGNSVVGTTTADGNQNEGKWKLVEDPSSSNMRFFAGIVSGAKNLNQAGSGTDEWVDVYVPNGSIVAVWTDVSVTAGDPCYLEPGQVTLTNTPVAGGVQVGWFLETVDRSSTAGLCLAKIDHPNMAGAGKESARSRTAVQLPTAAIWQNFDLASLRTNPFAGSLYETDFTHGEGYPMNSYVSATYAASAEGKSITENVYIGPAAIGELINFTTTDNQVVEWQIPCPITISGGNKWAFECRLKKTLVTDSKVGFFIGLLKPQAMSGDIITDAGALIDGGALGFQNKEADGDILDFIYDETSQTQNEHDDDYVTLTADTYATFGMYFNGTTIQGYVNGVSTGTAISAADIAAADFPTAEIFCPTFAMKAGHADDAIVTIDWIRVAQHAL